jgi:hypothetical protein
MQFGGFDPREKTTAENEEIYWLDHWQKFSRKVRDMQKDPRSLEPEEFEKLLVSILGAKVEGEDRQLMLDMALNALNSEIPYWSKVLFNNGILGTAIQDWQDVQRDAFHAFSVFFPTGNLSEVEMKHHAVLWLQQKSKFFAKQITAGDLAGHACQFAYLTQLYFSCPADSHLTGAGHDAMALEIDREKLMAVTNAILESAGLMPTSEEAMSEMLDVFKNDRANGVLARKLQQTMEVMQKINSSVDTLTLLKVMRDPSFSGSFISETQRNAVLLRIFYFAGKYLNNEIPQLADAAAKIIKICLEQTTGTFEQIKMKLLIGMHKRPDPQPAAEKLMETLDRKITAKKDMVEKSCQMMAVLLAGKDLLVLGEFISKTIGQISRLPHLQDQLIEILEKPDLFTVEAACVLARELMARSDFFEKKLIRSLFATSRDLIDPQKSAIIISILKGMREPEARQKFFRELLAGNDGAIFRNSLENERFVNMIKLYNFYAEAGLNDVTAEEKVQKTAALEFPELTTSVPPRDLETLKDYILHNRSTNISHDGNRLGKTGVDSPLEEEVTETRITINKDSRKFPASLSCNICVKMKSGVTHYLRMTKDNELLMRQLENGQTKNEVTLESLANNELEANTLRELHYFVLCKLRDIFVRRKAETASLPNAAPETTDPGPDPKPSDPENPPQNSDPLTTIRVEQDHLIDITTPAGQEMPVEKLSRDEEEDEREKKSAAKRISANQKKVLALLRAVHEGMVLPAIIPAEWSDIIIYERLPDERKKLYRAVPFEQVYQKLRRGEISLKDFHIRTVRAFTQALPFEKKWNRAPLQPEEVVLQDRETGIELTHAGDPRMVQLEIRKKTRQTALVNRKMSLFMQSGESYGLNLSAKPQLLIFQADDSPNNRALFNAMRQRSDEQIRREVSFSINQALEKNLKRARRKIVSPQMMGQVYQQAKERLKVLTERMKSLAVFLEDQRVAREIELRNKMVEETVGPQTKLRLPQVFSFDQTFNQGQFQSLAELWGNHDGMPKEAADEKTAESDSPQDPLKFEPK